MNDYMRALHRRFFRKPNLTELEHEIETARQDVRDCLDKAQRRRLMDLVDGQALLREAISLASFTTGFKLAWEIAKELEADGLHPLDEGRQTASAPEQERRSDQDDKSDSHSTVPVLWVRGYRAWLAARRGTGHIQKTRYGGQPTAVLDLSSVRCCALSVRGRAIQVSSYEVGHTTNETELLEVKQHGKETTIRGRHGAQAG